MLRPTWAGESEGVPAPFFAPFGQRQHPPPAYLEPYLELLPDGDGGHPTSPARLSPFSLSRKDEEEKGEFCPKSPDPVTARCSVLPKVTSLIPRASAVICICGIAVVFNFRRIY